MIAVKTDRQNAIRKGRGRERVILVCLVCGGFVVNFDRIA